jgi:Nitrous oxide-stimulated promoter
MIGSEPIKSPDHRPATEESRAVNLDFAGKRLAREWQTITAMVSCYCRDKHAPMDMPCAECQGLLDYAAIRLERCRFGLEKPVCAKCPVHCYQRARREQVRTVMRYAGPRMLWRHPILSLRHLLDGFRRAPALS